MTEKLRAAVLGAGRWAASAHLPGFVRSPLVDLVAICDRDEALAKQRAREFNIPHVFTDYQAMLSQLDLDVVDVCTRASPTDPDNHERLAFAALEAGAHCLCEKPVCHDYRRTWEAHELAHSKGLKTKVGLTFRYAPAMQYMYELIEQGELGDLFIFNGYEQNSQFISPDEPVTKADLIPPTSEDEEIRVSALEGYGAPIIDISLWCFQDELSRVVGTMQNFVPYRTDAAGQRVRTNIDDGDVYIGEYRRGGFCTIQNSYVAVGNYPGLIANIYGSRGALHCRLVEEFGVCQTLHGAQPDAGRIRAHGDPGAFLPARLSGRRALAVALYANLVHNFMQEIVAGGDENQGNFAQSARVQEIINAVELSVREARWVDLPLP